MEDSDESSSDEGNAINNITQFLSIFESFIRVITERYPGGRWSSPEIRINGCLLKCVHFLIQDLVLNATEYKAPTFLRPPTNPIYTQRRRCCL